MEAQGEGAGRGTLLLRREGQTRILGTLWHKPQSISIQQHPAALLIVSALHDAVFWADYISTCEVRDPDILSNDAQQMSKGGQAMGRRCKLAVSGASV